MHISQRPNGRWEAVVQHRGQRRKVVAKTKGEAQMRASEALIEMGGAPTFDPTAGELIAMWRARAVLSATYAADADRVIRLLPAEFTDRQVSTVTPVVIAQLYRTLERRGVSVHRIRRAHTVMSSAWSHAVEMELAHRNPFSAARKPSAPRRKVTPPTADQVAAVIEAIDDPQFLLYVMIASAVGARRGELVGIRWDDTRGDALILHRSISITKQSGMVVTEGKTGAKGHRVVALDGELVALLKAHRARQVAGALAAGVGAPEWVFSHDHGLTPWRPDYASRRFRQIADAAGITDCRLHDLRHYVATQLLVAGVPIKAVSERLGHRQLSTTSDVYGDYVPAADQQAAEVMASLRRRPAAPTG